MEKKSPSAVQLSVSEMPKLIPAGSLVELEQVHHDSLKFGDVIYIARKDRKVLCRFLRGWSSNGEPMLMVAQPGVSQPMVLAATGLVGKVARVSHGANVTEPNNESFLKRLLPRLSNYGTTGPLKKYFPG